MFAPSVKALQEICNEINVETEVSDNPESFTDENLDQFDAVIFSNSNNDAFLTDDQRMHFRRSSDQEVDWPGDSFSMWF